MVIWLTKKGTEAAGAIKGEETLTPEQAKQFEAGDWYINVHTKDHPAGEIRGQVKPSEKLTRTAACLIEELSVTGGCSFYGTGYDGGGGLGIVIVILKILLLLGKL